MSSFCLRTYISSQNNYEPIVKFTLFLKRMIHTPPHSLLMPSSLLLSNLNVQSKRNPIVVEAAKIGHYERFVLRFWIKK
jgi:hypothetical protein